MAGTALPPVIADATVTLSYAGAQAGIVAGQYYGYCTIADVKYELPNIASYPDLTATSGTPPINMNGNSLIAQEITYAALELQDVLDHYYQMPYTGTNAVILLTLREMNAKLACARVIDRYFSGGEANISPSAAERRGWVESIVVDIGNGRIRWDAPFGDAQPRGMLPVYQRSQGATVLPSPNDADPLVANGEEGGYAHVAHARRVAAFPRRACWRTDAAQQARHARPAPPTPHRAPSAGSARCVAAAGEACLVASLDFGR